MNFKNLILSAVAAMCMPVVAGAQLTKENLASDPYIAAGVHSNYHAPEYKDTPAPKGFKPFYVSHYGRHGSRFHTGMGPYEKLIPNLEKAQAAGLLTDEGAALLADIKYLRDLQVGRDGVLSRRGALEHQGIAQRLCKRVPGVFRQKDRKVVDCLSTSVHRCIQSMGNFNMVLKGFNPQLDVYLRTAANAKDILAASFDQRATPEYARMKEVQDSLMKVYLQAADAGRFFSDPDAYCRLTGQNAKYEVWHMYVASHMGGCLEYDSSTPVDPFSHFTPDQLIACASYFSSSNIVSFSHTVESGFGRDTIVGRPIVRDIVAKADAAIAGNDHCADLRFGHDTGVGPLMALLRVEGYDKVLTLAQACEQWPSYKYICMGSNMQFIFYRNKKGEVLVKMLRNEIETTIPELPTCQGPYYRWSDLREYMISR